MTQQFPLSHKVRVGFFVSLGIAILLFSILLVGGDRVFKSYATLHARFENVQGLNEGSMVSLSGIRIGTVKNFVFIPEENKLDVVLKVEADYLPRITEGSFVDIRTQGALGDKFLFIIPGPPSEKHLKNGDQIDVVKSTDLISLISEKSGDVTKIFDILNEIHRFTKTLNADDRSEKIMRNFSEASQELRLTAKDARELIADLKNQDSKKLSSAVDKFDHIMTKIDRGEGTLGALINDPSLHDSLKALIGAPDKKKSIKSLIRLSIEKPEKE